MIDIAFKYSLKIWLTSVLGAPVIYIITTQALRQTDAIMGLATVQNILDSYIILVSFGFIFSLVTWFAFFLLVWIVASYCPSKLQKAFIFPVGILLTGATFTLIFSTDILFTLSDTLTRMMYANVICIGAAIWLYHLGPKPKHAVAPLLSE